MSRLLLVVFLLVSSSSYSQKLFKQRIFKDLKLEGLITHSYGDSVYNFYVDKNSEKRNTDSEKEYYWFHQGDVKKTRGDFAGKLLHGKFEKFDGKGNLLEKGSFNYGLKDGEWVAWYKDGSIRSKYSWEDGFLVGKFQEFYDNGKLKKTGSFKKNRLDGSLTSYTREGEVSGKQKYNNGNLVIPKKEKEPKKESIDKKQPEKSKDQNGKSADKKQRKPKSEVKEEKSNPEKVKKSREKKKTSKKEGVGEKKDKKEKEKKSKKEKIKGNTTSEASPPVIP